ncbi:NF038132 family protein [Terriglobus sp.]|uniref:NF038132 family protein n=1 Tax=Terriglobus sp. TaxID=1889013 RepID=UPI003AFFE30E
MVATALLCPLAVQTAVADPLPSNLTCSGNCGVLGANGDVSAPPAGGSTYMYISTAGSNATAAIPTGALGGETNGSVLTTSVFSANANTPLNFYFDFVTSDGAGFSDYAWAALFNEDGGLASLLFDAQTEASGSIIPGQGLPAPTASLDPASVPIIPNATHWDPLNNYSGDCYAIGCGSTGWVNATYSIQTAGKYYLAFGVTNMSDTGYDSGLAISNITVDGADVAPVGVTPEPSSLVLLGTGLTSMAVAWRRRLKA